MDYYGNLLKKFSEFNPTVPYVFDPFTTGP